MLNEGIPLDRYEITMTRCDNLKEIYETLKVSFGPDFAFGDKHEMFGGWSLLPTIGDNIMLEFNSDNQVDRNWIYDEIHNRPPMILDITELQKKK